MAPAHAHLDFTGIRKRVLVGLFLTTVAASGLVVAATAGGGRSAAGPGLFEATGGPHVQVSALPGAGLRVEIDAIAYVNPTPLME